jgi:hypothetical protein
MTKVAAASTLRVFGLVIAKFLTDLAAAFLRNKRLLPCLGRKLGQQRARGLLSEKLRRP